MAVCHVKCYLHPDNLILRRRRSSCFCSYRSAVAAEFRPGGHPACGSFVMVTAGSPSDKFTIQTGKSYQVLARSSKVDVHHSCEVLWRNCYQSSELKQENTSSPSTFSSFFPFIHFRSSSLSIVLTAIFPPSTIVSVRMKGQCR